jgi:hypothetical protein
MSFFESAPHITPETGVKTKAPKKNFFVGCVIIHSRSLVKTIRRRAAVPLSEFRVSKKQAFI